MKKPESANELKSLIRSMQHRERFVFKCKDKLGSLEVYHTLVKDFTERNICVHLVDQEDAKPQNMLLKLMTDRNFERIYSFLE